MKKTIFTLSGPSAPKRKGIIDAGLKKLAKDPAPTLSEAQWARHPLVEDGIDEVALPKFRGDCVSIAASFDALLPDRRNQNKEAKEENDKALNDIKNWTAQFIIAEIEKITRQSGKPPRKVFVEYIAQHAPKMLMARAVAAHLADTEKRAQERCNAAAEKEIKLNQAAPIPLPTDECAPHHNVSPEGLDETE